MNHFKLFLCKKIVSLFPKFFVESLNCLSKALSSSLWGLCSQAHTSATSVVYHEIASWNEVETQLITFHVTYVKRGKVLPPKCKCKWHFPKCMRKVMWSESRFVSKVESVYASGLTPTLINTTFLWTLFGWTSSILTGKGTFKTRYTLSYCLSNRDHDPKHSTYLI